MRVKRCQVSGVRCRVSACIPPIPEKKLQHSKFLSHSLEIFVVQKIQIQGERNPEAGNPRNTENARELAVPRILAMERLGHPGPLHGLAVGVALPGLPVVVPLLELLEGRCGPGEPVLPLHQAPALPRHHHAYVALGQRRHRALQRPKCAWS